MIYQINMDDVLKDLKELRHDIKKIHDIFVDENLYVHKLVQKIILKVCKGSMSSVITKVPKGSMCSVKGKLYEDLCYRNIKHSPKIIAQGGGSSHKPDIYTQNGHIECKPKQSPDWGQSTLNWEEGHWVPKNELFQRYMDRVNFKPPPFLFDKITHSEWIKIKHDYKDEYLTVDNHEIQNFYRKKGCAYIQILGRGLYHLGEDPLEWGVPEFKVEQRIRIRVKVHSKSGSHLSVTAAFQPLNIKTLVPSEYSIDDRTRLPPNL